MALRRPDDRCCCWPSTSFRCSGRSGCRSPTSAPTGPAPTCCGSASATTRACSTTRRSGRTCAPPRTSSCCSITLQLLLGFGLALLLNRRFRTHSFWSTAILLPMMLAPAVVGTFWKYFFEPQYGIFNYIVNFFGGPRHLHDARRHHAFAVGHRAGRHLDVDALRDAAAARRPALDSALSLRGRRDRPRQRVDQVLAHHAADGDALHHPRGAVPRRSRTSRCSTSWTSSPTAGRAR